MSLALAELQAMGLVLGLLVALVFGNWPVRIAALTVGGGLGAWMYGWGRRVRFRVGDRVRIQMGPHRGASGVVVEPLPGGRGARVAVGIGDRTETVDFPGGYEIEPDTSLVKDGRRPGAPA
jgi:hypothetical protein